MKRSRLLSLLLVCLLLLSACGGGGTSSSQGSASSSGSASSADGSASEPDVSVMAPEQSEPEPEPPLPYVNPLTGEGCETDIGANRPVAIMLNNLYPNALPQMGVSQADIIYEMVAEGGITRMMAVFQDIEGAGTIGTVRSARDYYVSLAFGMDAIFLHAGGSPGAYTTIKNLGVTAMDCVNGPYEGSLFWRDQERMANKGMEHSVVTSDDTIQELFPTYSFLRTEHREDYEEPLVFMEEGESAQGESGLTATVRFVGLNNSFGKTQKIMNNL